MRIIKPGQDRARQVAEQFVELLLRIRVDASAAVFVLGQALARQRPQGRDLDAGLRRLHQDIPAMLLEVVKQFRQRAHIKETQLQPRCVRRQSENKEAHVFVGLEFGLLGPKPRGDAAKLILDRAGAVFFGGVALIVIVGQRAEKRRDNCFRRGGAFGPDDDRRIADAQFAAAVRAQQVVQRRRVGESRRGADRRIEVLRFAVGAERIAVERHQCPFRT